MNRSAVVPQHVLSTILKHDAKVTSYKFALLRAINDVVLAFPDMQPGERDVAIPLRVLAGWWVAYYWPFVAPTDGIEQGPRPVRQSGIASDMAFRPQLTALRTIWEAGLGSTGRAADGYLLQAEMRVTRLRSRYPAPLVGAYRSTVQAICRTLEMPIRHAGPGEWSIFARPERHAMLVKKVIAVPGTQAADRCLVVAGQLWGAFASLSLYIEALCIHEWCLFSEGLANEDGSRVDRGRVYYLLTDRPDNRRPLTWERNHIDLLLMEGHTFHCPWTQRPLCTPGAYDLDHLVPIALYPCNELWNLVPADPGFNQRVKRAGLPDSGRLLRAKPLLEGTYALYVHQPVLRSALVADVAARFSRLQRPEDCQPSAIVAAVTGLLEYVATSRNVARF